ncbi:hypothetical protein ACP70R_012111 [Stipagrostis hirtigluma subsp. patula]
MPDDAHDFIIETCCGALEEASSSVFQRHKRLCYVLAAVVAVMAVAAITAAALCAVHPVRATVEAASLSRGPALAGAGANDTAAAYSYDLSFTVAVRNPNVALRARHAAPLDAELRVAGRRFGGAVRLADAGQVLRPKETREYHVQAGSVRADGVEPGSALEVEVTLAGEVRYGSFHRARKAMMAVCLTKLPLPPPPGTTQVAPPFEPVKCHRS